MLLELVFYKGRYIRLLRTSHVSFLPGSFQNAKKWLTLWFFETLAPPYWMFLSISVFRRVFWVPVFICRHFELQHHPHWNIVELKRSIARLNTLRNKVGLPAIWITFYSITGPKVILVQHDRCKFAKLYLFVTKRPCPEKTELREF